MRFFTQPECEEWLKARKRVKPDAAGKQSALRLAYPTHAYRMYPWAAWVAAHLTYDHPTLLWITESGIWPSSENLHLYYCLRHNSQDLRLLEDAPDHLFLKHETELLASFLQVAMLNGWGGYILTDLDYVNAYFSHDEFIDFYSDDAKLIDGVRQALSSN